MIKKKFQLSALSAVAAFTLAACGDSGEPQMTQETEVEAPEKTTEDASHGDHSTMDHSGSGEIPEGLEEAADPTYPKGSTAVITADHMDGMDGSEATIVGAFDTTVYAITYTPETGGEPVENHKWVIHEELEDPGSEPLAAGDEAVIAADHMEGMNGANATIDSAEETTVYMVDFKTADGQEVTNHKWVTESELAAE
ncbi:YdhK family protein [Planococcus chinensis]|uniref:YdhK family protein n=1 Tax=Planococcus chinensis TaxID=272917 RepID=A0ABW4QHU2_9BACL